MRFPGIIPAVTTPFAASGEVDTAALQANVRALLDAGVHGIVGTGTMGEAGSLSTRERRDVIAAIVEAVDGRVPVIAGVSAGTAEQAGAYATMPPTPARSRSCACRRWATAPTRTRSPPSTPRSGPTPACRSWSTTTPRRRGSTCRRRSSPASPSASSTVVAVKECSGDVRRIPALLHATDLEVLVGGDDWALEGFCAGATGWVTGVADVAPAQCVALYEHCRAGELDAAREVYRRLLPLGRFDMTPKLVQYFKAAMDEVGLAGGPTRAPRLPLDDAERAELRDALASG